MSNTVPAAVAPETLVPGENVLELSGLLDLAPVMGLIGGVISRANVKITGCRVEHVRYEPRSSCVISYSVDYTVSGRSDSYCTRLYARAFDEDGYLRAQKQQKTMSWVAGALLAGPVLLSRQKAVLYEFPNDARLPHLSSFAHPAALLGIMQQIAVAARPGSTVSQRRLDLKLLRYKPEARCVLFCSVDCDPFDGSQMGREAVVLKTAKGDRVEIAHRAMTKLYSQLPIDAPLRIPKPLFLDPKLQISAVEWVEGEKLSDLWTSNQGPDVVKRAGRGLAWLHRLEAPATQEIENSSGRRKIEDAIALLETATPAVALHAQIAREKFQRAFADGASARTAWIHGDFHQGQVLNGPGTIWLIDFDNAKVGEIEQDLGNFAAQLRWLKLQGRLPTADAIASTFFESYRKEAGFMPDERRNRLWCAAGLVQLAAKQYRRLKPNWATTVPLLLSAAEAELDTP